MQMCYKIGGHELLQKWMSNSEIYLSIYFEQIYYLVEYKRRYHDLQIGIQLEWDCTLLVHSVLNITVSTRVDQVSNFGSVPIL